MSKIKKAISVIIKLTLTLIFIIGMGLFLSLDDIEPFNFRSIIAILISFFSLVGLGIYLSEKYYTSSDETYLKNYRLPPNQKIDEPWWNNRN